MPQISRNGCCSGNCSAVFGLVILLGTCMISSIQGYVIGDQVNFKPFADEKSSQAEREIFDVTKDDIIKALVSQLTNLVLEQRGNEISSESIEDEEIWPIFARGGEYGPKYDLFDGNEDDEDENENDYVKRSAAEIFVDALAKKDLESLLHQPDPSLTVQELPTNPKISFRKGSHMDFSLKEDKSTPTARPNQGMKEVTLESRSERSALSTQQQLRALAAEAASHQKQKKNQK